MIKFNLASIAIFGRMLLLIAWTATALHAAVPSAPVPKRTLTRSYALPHWLVIHGEQIPAREIRINVLEAYCRADSTDADWDQHTVIPHRAELISLNDDRTRLRLRDTLADGVTVEHTITATADEIHFELTARNPAATRSEAHWAQPCVRLAGFTGFDPQGNDIDDYLPKCFIHSDFRLGGLQPGETKRIRGRIYVVPNDVPALLARYARDFPEHHAPIRTAD